MSRMRVLVTASRSRVGMSVRLLLRDDPRVEVAAVDPADGFPWASDPGYAAALHAAAGACAKTILCSDQELAVAAQRAPDLLWCPARTVEAAADKAKLYANPRLFAPIHIVGGYIKSRGKPRRVCERVPDDVIVTEYLPGPEFSVDALYWHGQEIASVWRERTEVVHGVAVAGRVVPPDPCRPDLRAAEALELHGIVSIQFMRDQFGELLLTDLNCRPGGGITISAAAGVNLPVLLVDMLAEGKPLRATEARPGDFRTMLAVP